MASEQETAPYVTEDHQGILDKLLKEAFRRVGKQVIIQPIFSARGLNMANRGESDGEALRFQGIEHHFTNLIRVPEAVWELELTAFSQKMDMTPQGWSSLQPYRIGYLNGWHLIDQQIGDFKYIHKSGYLSSLVQMVERDRLDVLVHSRLITLFYLQQQGNTAIKPLIPPLMKLPAYLYLHKRHAPLVPDLTLALRAMKEDGTYQAIYDTINCQLDSHHTPQGC